MREQQDLAAEWSRLDAAVTAALADPKARNSAQMKAARDRLDAIDNRITEIAGQIAGRFPDYATLADPQPVDLVDIQKVLAPGRSADRLCLLPGIDARQELDLGRHQGRRHLGGVADRAGGHRRQAVAKLRCGLDYGAIEAEATAEILRRASAPMRTSRSSAPFDAKLSYQLWQSILGPAAAQLKGKKLLLVTPEPLAALPFQVLVTEEPKVAKPESGADLKATAFLGRSNAITVLPSIAALRTMRTNAKASAAPDAYLGFGDPVLTGTRSCPRIPAPDACPSIASAAGITRQGRAARAARRHDASGDGGRQRPRGCRRGAPALPARRHRDRDQMRRRQPRRGTGDHAYRARRQRGGAEEAAARPLPRAAFRHPRPAAPATPARCPPASPSRLWC